MNCTHNEQDLILYFYDELDDARRLDVEARLELCGGCRETLAGLQDLQGAIPREPLVEVDQAALEVMRAATSRRLHEYASVRPRPDRLRLVTIARWSVATAAAILVFAAGRLSVDDSQSGSVPSADLASVSDIRFDEEAGMVTVSYESVEHESVSGGINDAFIQNLLGHALRYDADPVSRLRAARALADPRVRPDPDVVRALEDVLSTQENPATVLQAMKALQRLHEAMPLSVTLRARLLDMMQNEENTAIRMRALEMLTNSEVVTMELTRVLQAATDDINPYIRNRATQALQRMEDSGAIERLE